MGKKEKLGRDSAKKSKKSTSRSQSDHNATDGDIVKDLSTTLDEAQGAEALAGMSAKKTRSGKEHGRARGVAPQHVNDGHVVHVEGDLAPCCPASNRAQRK